MGELRNSTLPFIQNKKQTSKMTKAKKVDLEMTFATIRDTMIQMDMQSTRSFSNVTIQISRRIRQMISDAQMPYKTFTFENDFYIVRLK